MGTGSGGQIPLSSAGAGQPACSSPRNSVVDGILLAPRFDAAAEINCDARVDASWNAFAHAVSFLEKDAWRAPGLSHQRFSEFFSAPTSSPT